jgi:uroporphyrinogen III methyltransferase / synthase
VSRPLDGLAVLVPRATGQAGELSDRLRALGAEPVEAPTIRIAEGDTAALADALRLLGEGAFTSVCFTSPNGVAAVASVLVREGRDASVFDGTRVAAIGPGTASRLREEIGIEPDLIPERSTTASLGTAFPEGSGRVLLPRADIASPTLTRILAEKGYEPVQVDAYVTELPDGLPEGVPERLGAGEVDVVVFTSSSTVRNFARLTEGVRWSATVVSIGPVTSATCREWGIEVDVEAAQHDLDGVVDAVVAASAD